MTASRARLARLALVAAALSVAVFGVIGARTDWRAGEASHASLIKDAAVVATQVVAERPSQPNQATPRVLWAATVVLALAALGWTAARPGVPGAAAVVAALPWRRRGPPRSFLS